MNKADVIDKLTSLQSQFHDGSAEENQNHPLHIICTTLIDLLKDLLAKETEVALARLQAEAAETPDNE